MSDSLRDSLFRLLSIGHRKYSTDPATRESATRLMLTNALRLHAEHTSRGEAARLVLELLSEAEDERSVA